MAHNDTIDIISSSPEFPDIGALVAKAPPRKPLLRTGSNAAPIPSDAVRLGNFTSAASIWRLSQVVEEEKPAQKSPPQPTKETPTIATSVSTVAVEVSTTTTAVSENKPGKKPRKPRKKKDETTATDENAPPKPPARRGRPPKQKDADGQTGTALPKSKVTKQPAAKPRASRKKAETVSKHFAASAHASTADAPVPEEPSKAPTAPKPPKPVPVRIDHEPVDLEPAVRRRLDWTPPPDDRPPPAAGNSSTVKELPSSTTAHTEPPVAFGKLLDTYGCKSENDQPSEVTKVDVLGKRKPKPENDRSSKVTKVDVLGKRKLIEMVATTTTTTTTTDKPTSPETSPTKPKAPKKKPRTITDLATAAYRIQDPVDDSASTVTSKQDTLLGYIDVEDDKAATKPSGPKTKAASKKPTKPRVSKKKPEPRKQLLLSPKSALRQVSGQDFVFGTSSQLVTEDTDLLRALHESMKTAGNAPDSDPFTSSPVKFSNLASRRKAGNNKLWKVGARDEDGDLMDLEIFDLTEAVEVPEGLLQQADRPSVGVPEDAKPGEPAERKTERAIEIFSSDPVVPERSTVTRPETQISTLSTKGKESVHRTTKPPPRDTVARPRARTPQRARSPSRESTPPQTRVPLRAKTPPRPTTPPRPSAVLDFDFDFDDYEPPPSNQEHYQLLEQSQKTSPSKTQQQRQQKTQQPQKKMDPPPRPKYELFTDAQLSREIASYGFKPIKKRAAMITLLEQCWESKTGAATGTSTGLGNNKLQEGTRSLESAHRSVDPIAVSPNRGRGQTMQVKGADLQEAEAGTKITAPAPKRPRGRPKKNEAATASPSRSTTDKLPKAAAAGTATATSKTAPLPVLSASTPKRQRRTSKSPIRPRRPTILEIPDSDIDDASDSDPFASSPPASSPDASPSPSPSASQLFSTPEKHLQDHEHDPAEIEMSLLTECEESLLDITSTPSEADLFKHITEAITTAPRTTTNPSEPYSWHEKILMYDPIIVEDLTVWLNTAGKGLDRVGWEGGEAGTEEVRRWCESKGVGWVWREGNRGQVRKRF